MTPTRANRIAARAAELVGSPFRLHGRNPVEGIDCVGLVIACLHASGVRDPGPNGYSLRGGNPDAIANRLSEAGMRPLDFGAPLKKGDLLLLHPGPMQLHFVILVDGGWVHAHAGLGRVVCGPVVEEWPILARFRADEHWQ